MSISRREFISRSALLAPLGTLPPWFAQSLLAQTTEPLIRHDVNSSDPEAQKAVEMYRTGVTAMKLKPAHDPTSWQFQANIHGYGRKEFEEVFPTDSGDKLLAQKVWGTCPHNFDGGDPTTSFLPWHRMYLHFFERIVRAAAQEPSSSRLGIPYWNWTKDHTLPDAFRENVNGSQDDNALYWGVRRRSVTALSNPLSIASIERGLELVEVTGLLDEPGFDADLEPTTLRGLNSGLEDGPHGFIHMLVGAQESDGSWRGMGVFEEAARDPVFWSHHCNIDRLWSHWRQNKDHKEPVDAEIQLTENERVAWSDVRHTFVDESGREIALTNRQVLVAAEILERGYVYDDLPREAVVAIDTSLQSISPMSSNTSPKAHPIQKLATAGPVEVAGKRTDVTLEPVAAFLAPEPVTEQTLIIQEIAASPGIKDSLFDVYVNLPANEQPTPDSPYYVGGLNIFNALAASRPMLPPGSTKAGGALKHDKHGGAEQRLPIADALRRQGWKQGDPIKVTIVPIPLDNQMAAPSTSVEPPPAIRAPTLSIGGFELIGR